MILFRTNHLFDRTGKICVLTDLLSQANKCRLKRIDMNAVASADCINRGINMIKSREKKRVGIASMLDKSEIKEYFDTFFILVLGIEFVIFVAHFIGAIGPDKGSFPWKQYFFISFIAPVVLTFLVGLIIIGFNYYIFGDDYTEPEEDRLPEEPGRKSLCTVRKALSDCFSRCRFWQGFLRSDWVLWFYTSLMSFFGS